MLHGAVIAIDPQRISHTGDTYGDGVTAMIDRPLRVVSWWRPRTTCARRSPRCHTTGTRPARRIRTGPLRPRSRARHPPCSGERRGCGVIVVTSKRVRLPHAVHRYRGRSATTGIVPASHPELTGSNRSLHTNTCSSTSGRWLRPPSPANARSTTSGPRCARSPSWSSTSRPPVDRPRPAASPRSAP